MEKKSGALGHEIVVDIRSPETKIIVDSFASSLQQRAQVHRVNAQVMSEADNVQAVHAKGSKTFVAESKGTFEKFLGQEVRLLRLSGLDYMSSVFTGDTKSAKKWEAWPFTVGIIFYAFLSTCQAWTIIRFVKNNPGFAVQVFTSLLNIVHCSFKGLRLYFWRQELYKLLRGFAVLWDGLHVPLIFKNEIFQSARETYTLTKYYCAITIAMTSAYSVEAILHFLRYHLSQTHTNTSYDYSMAIIPTNYPVSLQTLTRYVNCILWEECVLIYFVIWSVAADGLFAQLTTHTAIHFRVIKVLCHDLMSIAMPNENSNINNINESIHQLSNIVRRHRDLHACCNIIEAMFNPIIFVLMLLTAASMCCFLFQLEKEISAGNWGQAVKYLAGVTYAFVQAFIYCSHAEMLTYQICNMMKIFSCNQNKALNRARDHLPEKLMSGQLVHAAYNSQWIDREKEFKSVLLIIMMRCQKEFHCTAYGIFSVRLHQITTIVKTAGSYFTLLKSMA